MAEIAARAGAPIGSLAHFFASREAPAEAPIRRQGSAKVPGMGKGSGSAKVPGIRKDSWNRFAPLAANGGAGDVGRVPPGGSRGSVGRTRPEATVPACQATAPPRLARPRIRLPLCYNLARLVRSDRFDHSRARHDQDASTGR
jgi:hypothetical protein